ncbi:manganese ABC transporter substrate-binding protein/adhesin MntA [Bacillus subtilis]|uniref:manganese ABC transporter substrate-binding protein/adhesin MntA n=1 Tax=Bacillus TaxID=1386 RepID=UPI000DC59A21|nr:MULTISPECIES: manganese ABC transporter substrate-binding protein/adhesin MntA [Bacillus]MDI6588253.1 manganese ABC transporter substrate-binding protein/adhesin MntA [Bacillus subtilis]MDM5456944.1 manganese ABC transporter substrate-binding protein/adhesin MntA [Bacillus subtilis]MEC3652533.1 manganese ABC transporter substrate-binding protein/adhesin MntA [Bacillus subtilis]NJJ25168.1 manganese ABC transporter substrate-binding protein/adhesin MntA [Bacillus subtilis]QFP70967.1 manganese
MRRGLMAAVLFATFALTGCGTDSAGKSADQQLQVTATTSQIADAAENIGGKHVKVTSLMGPGVDPHLYKASQGDTKKLMSADVVLYSGLHLEGKMEDVLQKIGEQKQATAVAEAIPKNKLIPAGEGKTFDPHVWFSIPLWIYAVDEIEAQFSKAMPQHADAFRKNAKEYKEDLQYLDKWSRKEIAHIPEKSRVLVTAHDAFAYFGNEYGFKVKGLQGLSTDSDYGLRDVQELVDLLTEKQIKAVFVESSVSEKSINAVVEGAKEKGHTVTIGGQLYSDAMGEKGTKEGTYEGMFRHNINTITKALK